MKISPKYEIGDKVWRAYTTVEHFQHDCPDCLGEKEWKAESPAGTKYTFPCPRCSSMYQSNSALSLKYRKFVPSTQLLTIGSVRLDTADKDHPVSYMCVETGVGSGSIH